MTSQPVAPGLPIHGDTASTTLAATRIGIGAVAWLTPNLAGRVLGLDTVGNPQAPFLTRLYGVRDVVLGAGSLGSEGQARRKWLLGALVCDAADAAAALLGNRAGYLSGPVATRVGLPAVAGVALGLMALRETNATD